MVDVTAGCGGYSAAIRERLGAQGLLLAVDRDPEMAEISRARLARGEGARPRVFVGLFSQIGQILAEANVTRVDGLTADLGVSSPQIDDPQRGFSYRQNGPLSMQMTPGESVSAEEIVNQWPEKRLAEILHRLGEERFARRIARCICDHRRARPIHTTLELAEVIRRAFPPGLGRRKHHPARKSFQAIRIACNSEIEEIEELVAALPRVLKPGARAVVVSYHSLEDRIIKRAFAEGARNGFYEILTRRVLRPSSVEVEANPRSRSARLRAVRRIQETSR